MLDIIPTLYTYILYMNLHVTAILQVQVYNL